MTTTDTQPTMPPDGLPFTLHKDAYSGSHQIRRTGQMPSMVEWRKANPDKRQDAFDDMDIARVGPAFNGSGDDYGPHVLISESEAREYAAYLVHAANCFPALVARVKDLERIMRIVHECGLPEKVELFDEEGVEGWHWTHPNGEEWNEIGSWDAEPPMHPLIEAALSGAQQNGGQEG